MTIDRIKRALVPLLAGLVLACGGSTASSSPTASATAAVSGSTGATGGQTVADVIEGFGGPFRGAWKFAATGSGGTIATNVTVDTKGHTVAFTMAIKGDPFGNGTPPNETYNGTWDAAGAHFSGTSTALGPYTMQIDKKGLLTLKAESVPGGKVKAFAMTGTVTGDNMDLTFTVSYKAGGPDATGIATLTR